MTGILLSLLLTLTAGSVEWVPLDNPPPEYGLVVNETGALFIVSADGPEVAEVGGVEQRGRWMEAGVGVHGDHVRLYWPSFEQSMKDSYRWLWGATYSQRVKIVSEHRQTKLIHELSHVLDWQDDGLQYGSPGHADHVSADPYCQTNDAERYACAVVETGRIR